MAEYRKTLNNIFKKLQHSGLAPRNMRMGVQIPTSLNTYSLVGVTVQAPLHFLEAVGVRAPRTPPVAPVLQH